jgi:hypothetical protein
VAVRLLGFWFRIPPVHIYPSFENIISCQVELSVMGRSLVQRNPTECGVSECDLETSIRRPWPTGGCCAMGQKNKVSDTLHTCSMPRLIKIYPS